MLRRHLLLLALLLVCLVLPLSAAPRTDYYEGEATWPGGHIFVVSHYENTTVRFELIASNDPASHDSISGVGNVSSGALKYARNTRTLTLSLTASAVAKFTFTRGDGSTDPVTPLPIDVKWAPDTNGIYHATGSVMGVTIIEPSGARVLAL